MEDLVDGGYLAGVLIDGTQIHDYMFYNYNEALKCKPQYKFQLCCIADTQDNTGKVKTCTVNSEAQVLDQGVNGRWTIIIMRTIIIMHTMYHDIVLFHVEDLL